MLPTHVSNLNEMDDSNCQGASLDSTYQLCGTRILIRLGTVDSSTLAAAASQEAETQALRKDAPLSTYPTPFTTATKSLANCLTTIRPLVPAFDQRANLREMIRYGLVQVGAARNEQWTSNSTSDPPPPPKLQFEESEEKSRNHVLESCAIVTTKADIYFGGFGNSLSISDVLSDLHGIYRSFQKGFSKICVLSTVLLLINVVAQNCRMLFIAKECYNLRKMFAVGNGLTEINKFKAFKYQGYMDAYNYIWHFFWELLKRLRRPFSTDWMELWKIPYTESVDSGLFDFDSDHRGIDAKNKRMLKRIQESFPDITWSPYFLVPSIKLTNLQIECGKRINMRLENKASGFKTEDDVLDLLYEQMFLHFIKFQAAEMKKTEVTLETLPQALLRLIPLMENVLKVGFLMTYSSMVNPEDGNWLENLFPQLSSLIRLLSQIIETTFLFLPIMGLGFGISKASIDKIGYYFAVYGHGQEFDEPKYYFADYYKLNLIISTLAHSTVIFSLLLLSACSCITGTVKFFPFLLNLLALTFAFWRESNIQFHGVELSLTKALTSFSYSSPELTLKNLLMLNFQKFVMILILLAINVMILYFDDIYGQNLYVVGIIILGMYMIGLLLELLCRGIWKYTWGKDFAIYTVGKQSDAVDKCLPLLEMSPEVYNPKVLSNPEALLIRESVV